MKKSTGVHMRKHRLSQTQPPYKVKGLPGADRWSQDSRGDVKPSTGNTVGNIVVAMYRARWVLELPGDHLVNYRIV